MRTAPITTTSCSPARCERERRAACAALAAAYAQESELTRRFQAMTRDGLAAVAPVMADEVIAVLAARDRAEARLGEWAA